MAEVLEAIGLGLGLGTGVLVLAALALSVRVAHVGRRTSGEDGLPLVGSRHEQFGDATTAARAAALPPAAADRPLRLVPASGGGQDQAHPVRAA